VIVLLVDVAQVRAAFPDWRIITRGTTWQAIRRTVPTCPARFAALGRPMLTADSLGDLAIQLAALECSLGIAPMS
jgi:hypothetical protein